MAYLGIDFGSTNVRAAAWCASSKFVRLIPSSDPEKYALKNCIAFMDNGEAFAGNQAKHQPNTINDVKRFIGLLARKNEILQQPSVGGPAVVVDELHQLRVKVHWKSQTRLFLPEGLCSYLLAQIKKNAQDYLKQPVVGCVITVPPYFNSEQRRAMLAAAHLAGLKNARLIDEPLAAALAYDKETINNRGGVRKNEQDLREHVLVIDVGGKTHNVSIFRRSSVHENPQLKWVLTTTDKSLGGQNFTRRLAQHFAREESLGFDDGDSSMFAAVKSENNILLHDASEEAKTRLSYYPKAKVEIHDARAARRKSLTAKENGSRSCRVNVTHIKQHIYREKFEEWCSDLFDALLNTIGIALEKAELNRDDIGEVALIGGSSKIPRIRELITEYFHGQGPKIVELSKSSGLLALGATVHAAQFAVKPTSTSDTGLATIKTTSFAYAVEISPGNLCFQVLPKNAPIPTAEFTVSYQPPVRVYKNNVLKIAVYEIKEEHRDNHLQRLLGSFDLKTIPFLSHHDTERKIQVSMQLDDFDYLDVTIKHLESGNSNSLKIKV